MSTPSTETGKDRSQRIQIDYFRQSTDISRLRRWCIAAGVIASLVYVTYVVVQGDTVGQLSTGPLADAHAAFEHDCRQCHAIGIPLNSAASRLNVDLIGIQSSQSLNHIESTCQKCHRVGTHHRATMNDSAAEIDQNCSSCHQVHQGRQHDLTRVSQQQCSQCHESLTEVCGETPQARLSVTSFSIDAHGDFNSLQGSDPGRIKFDHAQHLLPGQVKEGQRGQMTLSMLAPEFWKRYRTDGQSADDVVRLDCGSCHELAGMPEEGNTTLASGDLGRSMMPVSFQRHCSACHAIQPGLANESTTPLPHAVRWRQIDLLLAATLAGAERMGAVRDDDDFDRVTPKIGEGTGDSTLLDDDGFQTLDDEGKLAMMRVSVELQCLKCHQADDVSPHSIDAAITGKLGPMIPPRWLQSGFYDHAAHRRMDCRYCHKITRTDREDSIGHAQDHQHVMIAGVESCVGCHRPSESRTPDALLRPQEMKLIAEQPTWASDRCTTCHRYHAHDDPRSRPTTARTKLTTVVGNDP